MAFRSEGIKDIGHRQDLAQQGDLIVHQSGGIAGAVDALMMRGGDQGHLAQLPAEVDLLQDAPGIGGVIADVTELLVGELVVLGEHSLAHGDLAIIMEQGRDAQHLALLGLQAQDAADLVGVEADALGMTGREGVARIDGAGEGFHQAVKGLFLLLIELGVFDLGCGQDRNRIEYLLVLPGEGTLQLVEDLEHPDDLTRLVAHGRGEQVAGVVARLPVDIRIEAAVGISIGDVDDLAALHDRPGDAEVGGKADLRFTMGDPGPEFVMFAVENKDRAAIALQHLFDLVHNQSQEFVKLHLRGDRAGDLEQHLESFMLALLHMQGFGVSHDAAAPTPSRWRTRPW
ncbi:MAG: hypothetical protein BWY77_01436 [bacterium ADurb.Bin431]|nr:MAG: hypothetical protein BWY77_01436 [bacterium ADurb.Bin431]